MFDNNQKLFTEFKIDPAKELHKNCQFIIEKFCLWKEKINWPKEMKIAKDLLKKYPVEFWDFLPPDFFKYTCTLATVLKEKDKLPAEYEKWKVLTGFREKIVLES